MNFMEALAILLMGVVVMGSLVLGQPCQPDSYQGNQSANTAYALQVPILEVKGTLCSGSEVRNGGGEILLLPFSLSFDSFCF